MRLTHCKRGHERTPENLIGRTCKKCHAMGARKRRTHCNMGHQRTPDNLYPNGTCKQCAITRASRWNKENVNERIRIQRKNLWKTRYKMTEEEYAALLQKQNGVCAICKRPPLPESLFVVDHDHGCCSSTETCGKCVRGLIHQRCNNALGIFLDNSIICRNAAEYLENPPAQGLLKNGG